MLTPQFILPMARELVVDLFAGGGGASTGIEQAIGRHVDIAVNHDPEAISLHTANHPQTKHFICDVFEVDPVEVTGGQPIGLLWASPDCKHFSKAKGGKPVSKKIRGLANIVVEWVEKLGPVNKPRLIVLENVEEFQTWGPLDDNNMPDKARAGEFFRAWKAALESHGYVIEHRELRASDYGTPTIRKRFFMVARCDGQPIVWPEPTTGKPGTLPVTAHKLAPWRTAAECIDWSIPCPSIFERKKPLAEATLRRIARGIQRYVTDAEEPFIVPGASFLTEFANASTQRNFPANEPLRTQCAQVKGGHFALVSPTLIQTGYGERPGQAPRSLDLHAPLGTVVGGGAKHALVTAFMAQHNAGNVGHDARKPVSTITSTGSQQSVVAATLVGVGGRAGQSRPRGMGDPVATVTSKYDTALVAANLVHMGHGEISPGGVKRWSKGIRDVTDPLNTVTASGSPAAIATSHLVKLRGTSTAQGVDEPLHTVSAQGTHFAQVQAFLIAYYGTDQAPELTNPMPTATTKHRFGIVTVHGEQYEIVDIGLRMLTPRELYRAQGFPDTYQIEHGHDGKPMTKTAQVRMVGNSVCPPLAAAIVAANYEEQHADRIAA